MVFDGGALLPALADFAAAEPIPELRRADVGAAGAGAFTPGMVLRWLSCWLERASVVRARLG